MADDSDSQSTSSNDSMTDGSSSSDEIKKCVKLQLPKNIAAYLTREELSREIETVSCDNNLLDKVVNNYIIAQKILSNLPWQDKLLCKHVCLTWHSAILALQREQLSPADFVIDFANHILKISYNIHTEPMVVFSFVNMAGLNMAFPCTEIIFQTRPWLRHKDTYDEPWKSRGPCIPPCGQKHCSIDLVEQRVCAPKQCMLTVRAGYLSYMPLPESPTNQHTILKFGRQFFPYVCGIYIPVIPDVKFHVINIKSSNDMQKGFFDVVQDLSKERIFKGVIVYVTEKYLLDSVEDFQFLNYFKDVQPDIPYALGGCIVEDTMYDQSDMNHLIDCINYGTEFVSETLMSVGLFTVPKGENNAEPNKYNFDMYSLVIESSAWTKSKIQAAINEFANKVPRFEHSVVLKLSCVGRDQKHDVEQKCFREAFPNTRLIGCYGNGEIGLNHPERPPPEEKPCPMKRQRPDQQPQFGIIYSYSTIFVYIGWGKIIS